MSIYQPPSFEGPIDLDLSRNEGRPALNDIDLAIGTMETVVGRYPDTSRLASLIAARHEVEAERVLVTAGGDDAIFRCMLWCGASKIVTTTPTFEMIRRYAEQVGALLAEIPWWDGVPPTDDMAESEAEVAVIVSPNNPTGSMIEEADLFHLADQFRLVVLDAAYAEFADIDLTPAALRLSNVVVVRTFSKAFGLAGLRVGYLLGPPDLVREVGAFGSPYAVSALSAVVASDVLEAGMGRVLRYVSKVVDERGRLVELLREFGAAPLPSQGNFVLATDTDPETVVSSAASLGVGLRSFPGRPGLERCVRIGLPGVAEDFDRLASVLATVLSHDPEMEVADVT